MKLEQMINCPHTVRCLNRAGIETMEQLSACTVDDLLQIRGVGRVIANDVYRAIAAWKENIAVHETKTPRCASYKVNTQ